MDRIRHLGQYESIQFPLKIFPVIDELQTPFGSMTQRMSKVSFNGSEIGMKVQPLLNSYLF
jgi:hypothetical protein